MEGRFITNLESRIKNLGRAKIRSFTDLIVWQQGHQLVLRIYYLTKQFPKEEVYGLTQQMRRSAVSITSNIAEGFGRRSYKEKTQFYYLAQSSLIELQNQLLIARDVSYLKQTAFQLIANQTISVQKLLSKLIKKTKQY